MNDFEQRDPGWCCWVLAVYMGVVITGLIFVYVLATGGFR